MQGVTGQSERLLQWGRWPARQGQAAGRKWLVHALNSQTPAPGAEGGPTEPSQSHLPELWVTGLEHLVLASCRGLLSQ